MLAPIVVFSYNRPDHLRQTLESLAKNDLAQDSVLYIYCDGAKADASEEQRQRVAENRKVAHSILGFREVHVVDAEQNKGLADSIIGGVTEVVNRYGKVIVLEDDMITSRGFLKFMNDALSIYADDVRVMHIVGYMFPVKHQWLLPETFFYEVPYPGGGWATWQRAWNYFSNDIDELYDYWSCDWKRFNKWGPDLQEQLTMNYTGEIKTWFIRWHGAVLKNNGLTLYPGHSLTTNIGFDGSGENCIYLEKNKYWVKQLCEHVDVKRRPIRENRIAGYLLWGFWSGHWYSRRNRRKVIEKVKEFIGKK